MWYSYNNLYNIIFGFIFLIIMAYNKWNKKDRLKKLE